MPFQTHLLMFCFDIDRFIIVRTQHFPKPDRLVSSTRRQNSFIRMPSHPFDFFFMSFKTSYLIQTMSPLKKDLLRVPILSKNAVPKSIRSNRSSLQRGKFHLVTNKDVESFVNAFLPELRNTTIRFPLDPKFESQTPIPNSQKMILNIRKHVINGRSYRLETKRQTRRVLDPLQNGGLHLTFAFRRFHSR